LNNCGLRRNEEQIEVFWIVTSCSVVVRYKRFGCPGYLHLQGEVASRMDPWNDCILP